MINVNENNIEELDLPGRKLRWVITQAKDGSEFCSMCVIKIQPGAKVTPAHLHPNGEELVYIVAGSGRALVGTEVQDISEGSAVLFPKGVPHMLKNTGSVVMKVACFYAPAADPSGYEYHPEIDIDDFDK